MRKLLLLFITSLALASCLKSAEDPQPTICILEPTPTFIGKWEQISFSESRYNSGGEKIKETTVEFKENDENAIKIEFLEPDEVENPEDIQKDHWATGKYISKIFDEEARQIETIEDRYKLLKCYGCTLPVIEIRYDKGSIRYVQNVEQNEKGIILTLAYQVTEGEGAAKVFIERILTFVSKI